MEKGTADSSPHAGRRAAAEWRGRSQGGLSRSKGPVTEDDTMGQGSQGYRSDSQGHTDDPGSVGPSPPLTPAST